MFGKIIGWLDDRIPLTRVWNMHIAQYPAPKNFNFSSTAGVSRCIQASSTSV